MEGDEGFDGALEYFPDTFNPKKIQPEYSGELLNNQDVYKHMHYYVYSLMYANYTCSHYALYLCLIMCCAISVSFIRFPIDFCTSYIMKDILICNVRPTLLYCLFPVPMFSKTEAGGR